MRMIIRLSVIGFFCAGAGLRTKANDEDEKVNVDVTVMATCIIKGDQKEEMESNSEIIRLEEGWGRIVDSGCCTTMSERHGGRRIKELKQELLDRMEVIAQDLRERSVEDDRRRALQMDLLCLGEERSKLDLEMIRESRVLVLDGYTFLKELRNHQLTDYNQGAVRNRIETMLAEVEESIAAVSLSDKERALLQEEMMQTQHYLSESKTAMPCCFRDLACRLEHAAARLDVIERELRLRFSPCASKQAVQAAFARLAESAPPDYSDGLSHQSAADLAEAIKTDMRDLYLRKLVDGCRDKSLNSVGDRQTIRRLLEKYGIRSE